MYYYLVLQGTETCTLYYNSDDESENDGMQAMRRLLLLQCPMLQLHAYTLPDD